jgi:serpin B
MTDHHDDEPLEYALDRLATTGPHPPWPEGSELRRRATRRHRRRLAGTGIGALAVVAAIAVIGANVLGSHDDQASIGPPTHTKLAGGAHVSVSAHSAGSGAVHLVATVQGRVLPAARAATTATLARDETSFALALTKQLAGHATANVVDSPLSADVALSMLELGARGATQSGIATTLGASNLSPAQQSAGWAKLQTSLRSGPKADTLNIANSAWLQKGVAFSPAYLAQLAQSFGDDAYQADFAHDNGKATAAINAWVSAQTAGRITQLFAPGSLPAETVFVLANALHFKAPWDQSLEMGSAAAERFSTPSGTTAVPAINAGPTTMSAAVTKGYTAVAIPYEGDRYQALVVQPDATSLTRYLDSLDVAGLSGVIASLETTGVNLTMPSLALSTNTSLNGPLSTLGMSAAFGPNADLSGISHAATQVGEVQQADNLIVDKTGTDASAATGIAGTASAVEPPSHVLTIRINRPYLLFLRDTKTGLILMATAVYNPAAG